MWEFRSKGLAVHWQNEITKSLPRLFSFFLKVTFKATNRRLVSWEILTMILLKHRFKVESRSSFISKSAIKQKVIMWIIFTKKIICLLQLFFKQRKSAIFSESNHEPRTSVCIFSILFSIHFLRCRQGEFVQQSRASLVADHFYVLLTFISWFRGDIVGRD